MNAKSTKVVRCAIYTRVSTDQGLEQDFNSLDAQYDASQAYIRSQAHAGWPLVRDVAACPQALQGTTHSGPTSLETAQEQGEVVSSATGSHASTPGMSYNM